MARIAGDGFGDGVRVGGSVVRVGDDTGEAGAGVDAAEDRGRFWKRQPENANDSQKNERNKNKRFTVPALYLDKLEFPC